MQQETIFQKGQEPKNVDLNQEKVKQLKQLLGFQPRSEYYLRLPDEAYVPILLLCLTATNGSLSKKKKSALNSLEEVYRKEIQTLYLSKNEMRQQFIGPYQLEVMSNTLNYNQKMFKKCHTAFKESDKHSLNIFKDKFKVVIIFGQIKKCLGAKKKTENPQEILYIIKDNKSTIVCAYSAKSISFNKKERSQRTSSNFILERQKQMGKQIERTNGDVQQIINEGHIKKNQQEQNGDQESESKLHCTYNAMLVFILIALLYISFTEINPNFFKGMSQKNNICILQQLIQILDCVRNLI